MATKNMGYGSICNTGRLHTPLFFNVCTEVLAAPVVPVIVALPSLVTLPLKSLTATVCSPSSVCSTA